MSGQNRKDVEARLGRVPRGITRIWIGEEPWNLRIGDTALACHQPLTNQTFGITIGNLDVSDPVAVKKAILAKSKELARLKTKEVTNPLLELTT